MQPPPGGLAGGGGGGGGPPALATDIWSPRHTVWFGPTVFLSPFLLTSISPDFTVHFTSHPPGFLLSSMGLTSQVNSVPRTPSDPYGVLSW
jgi:hypothetical protein